MKTSLRLILIVVGLTVGVCSPLPKEYQKSQCLQHPAVANFREYLQIDTSKEENLEYAVDFWRRQATELELPFAVHWPAARPVCVLTWPGAEPALPSVMLNSHMDVVSVEPEDWTYPPFAAHMDDNGDIYGRGTQDTKDIGIQYIEAIRRLKNENVTLLRTLHVTFIPDEETGSKQGMIPFIDTEEFKALNVGFALDEGLSSPDDTLFATYQDKRPWQIQFTVRGTSDHGSRMPEVSAAEKLRRLIESISTYRDLQKNIMESGGPYNNLNINMIHGGLAANIVPSKMSLVVDMRLSVSANASEMNDVVDSWAAASGNDTTVEYIRRLDESAATSIDDNPYWDAMQSAAAAMGLKIEPVICPATSDMIYLRSRGIPALGFSAKTHTITRMHGANEYINVDTFLKGIDIYVEILKKLGNTL